jgi:integrase
MVPTMDDWQKICAHRKQARIVGLSKWAIGRYCNDYMTKLALSSEYLSHLRHTTPHDLRRTLAKLMRKENVELEQIAAILGHSSIRTTELYLGSELKLEQGEAGTDQVPIQIIQ